MFNPLEVFKLKAFKSYFSNWQGADVEMLNSANRESLYFFEPSSFFFNEFMFYAAEYYVYTARNWYAGELLFKDLMGERSLYSIFFDYLGILELFFLLIYAGIVVLCCFQFVWKFCDALHFALIEDKINNWEFFFYYFGVLQNLYLLYLGKLDSLFFFQTEEWWNTTRIFSFYFFDFGWYLPELFSEKFLNLRSGLLPNNVDNYFRGYNAVVEFLGFSLRKLFLFCAGEQDKQNWQNILYSLRSGKEVTVFSDNSAYLFWLAENPVSFSNLEGFLVSFFFKSWSFFPFFMLDLGSGNALNLFIFLFSFFSITALIIVIYILLCQEQSLAVFSGIIVPFFFKLNRGWFSDIAADAFLLPVELNFYGQLENLSDLFFEYFSLFCFFQHTFVLTDFSFSAFNIVESDSYIELWGALYKSRSTLGYSTDLVDAGEFLNVDASLIYKYFIFSRVKEHAKFQNSDWSADCFIKYDVNFSNQLIKGKKKALQDYLDFIGAQEAFLNYDLLISDFFHLLSKSFLSLFWLLQSMCLFVFSGFSLGFNFLNFLQDFKFSGLPFESILLRIYSNFGGLFNFFFLHFGYNFFFLFLIFFSILLFFFYSNFMFLRLKDTSIFLFFRLILITVLKIILDILTHSKGKVYFVSLLLFLFFFLVFLNFFGLIPYSFAVTSYFSVTFFFSFSFFFMLFFIGILMHGMQVLGLFIPPGTPFLIVPLLFVIEVISYFARVFSLAIRLFANITAGHIPLYIFSWFVVMLFDVFGFSVLGFSLIIILWVLESFISVSQAYVFVVLITLYLNEILYLEH